MSCISSPTRGGFVLQQTQADLLLHEAHGHAHSTVRALHYGGHLRGNVRQASPSSIMRCMPRSWPSAPLNQFQDIGSAFFVVRAAILLSSGFSGALVKTSLCNSDKVWGKLAALFLEAREIFGSSAARGISATAGCGVLYAELGAK